MDFETDPARAGAAEGGVLSHSCLGATSCRSVYTGLTRTWRERRSLPGLGRTCRALNKTLVACLGLEPA